jgi:hypothetical protein
LFSKKVLFGAICTLLTVFFYDIACAIKTFYKHAASFENTFMGFHPALLILKVL